MNTIIKSCSNFVLKLKNQTMGKYLKFLASLLLTVGLLFFLNTDIPVGGNNLPALGKFLNPFSGFWQNAEPTLNVKPLDLSFDALTDEVSVSYDDRLVPHVFAQNDKDLVFVQGYLHAKDRLWQMDFATRAISGRLSEVVGIKALEYDKYQRRKGYTFAAENALIGWKKFPVMYELLERYTAGVNQYISNIDHRKLPLEFKLMGYNPEPWTILKSALFFKSMAQSLCSGDDDLELTNSKKLLGDALFNQLFPETYKEEDPIIPNSVKFNFKAVSSTISNTIPNNNSTSFIDFKTMEKPDPNNGSNNWVVGPSKTLNHKPILCGDPHLRLRFPSVWYEMQLQTPEFNAYGVTFPGIPYIIIGFNNDIAWTETNVGQDVSDWYNITWKDATKKEYKLDGSYTQANWRIENIIVRGLKDVVLDTVKYTKWGPVVFETDTLHKDMAWRWIAHDVPDKPEIATFQLLNKAKNFQQYVAALDNFISPAQNFAFACKNGDIALRVNGALPIKTKGQGRFVQDGSDSRNAWQGIIPDAQRPIVFNPPSGFVSSSNQRSTNSTYPYYYNSEGFEAYRGRIANNALTKMDSITVEDMKKLQNSSYSIRAEECIASFMKQLDTTSLNAIEKEFLSPLKKWNYEYNAKDMTPVIFELWFKAAKDTTFDEFYSQSNWKQFAIPSDIHFMHLIRDNPTCSMFDILITKDKIENARDIITLAFKKACTEIPIKKAANKGMLNWAIYNNANVEHTAKISAFSKSGIESNGTKKALNALDNGHGPSWRMVVEMDSIPHAWVVFPGGESGNPGSANYDAYLDKWTKGDYFEALFLQANVTDKRIKFTQKFTKSAKKQ